MHAASGNIQLFRAYLGWKTSTVLFHTAKQCIHHGKLHIKMEHNVSASPFTMVFLCLKLSSFVCKQTAHTGAAWELLAGFWGRSQPRKIHCRCSWEACEHSVHWQLYRGSTGPSSSPAECMGIPCLSLCGGPAALEGPPRCSPSRPFCPPVW